MSDREMLTQSTGTDPAGDDANTAETQRQAPRLSPEEIERLEDFEDLESSSRSRRAAPSRSSATRMSQENSARFTAATELESKRGEPRPGCATSTVASSVVRPHPSNTAGATSSQPEPFQQWLRVEASLDAIRINQQEPTRREHHLHGAHMWQYRSDDTAVSHQVL